MTEREASEAAEVHRNGKREKRERQERNRDQRELSKDLSQKRNLKQLRMQVNPTLFIPYDQILAEGGYLGHHMKDKISQRKREIMDEMSKILKVEERFNVKL